MIATGEPRPPYDVWCPLGSLPLALRIEPENLPREPYLLAPPIRIDEWQQRLEAAEPPRVGIAWAGNRAFRNDHNRSIGLARLLRAVKAIDATPISLQKSVGEDERSTLDAEGIRDYERHIGDFADTAALISCLDLVISSDTSEVHLAGALGRPVWVLLHYDADWRWLADRSDSPWYSSARLFRQQVPGDWDNVVDQVVRCWRDMLRPSQ